MPDNTRVYGGGRELPGYLPLKGKRSRISAVPR